MDLRGVTTVYGDVALRARMASRVLRLMGHDDVPVHAGAEKLQSGREIWWAGREGRGIDDLDDEQFSGVAAVDVLVDAGRRHHGDLVVVAIGPLTNIAEALDRDPEWAGRVRQLIVMGGDFAERRPEHNVSSDVVAADKVLISGTPSLYVGLDVTTTVWFDEADLGSATSSGPPLATLVDGQMWLWWRHKNKTTTNHHDPLAVLAMLEPELFTFERSGWRVVKDGDQLGTLESVSEAPALERARDVEIDAAQEVIRSRLSAGASTNASASRGRSFSARCVHQPRLLPPHGWLFSLRRPESKNAYRQTGRSGACLPRSTGALVNA